MTVRSMGWRDRRANARLRISMTPNATDNTNARAVTSEETRRYAELNIGDEEFVIYDRQNHQAWLQSTVAVPVEEIC